MEMSKPGNSILSEADSEGELNQSRKKPLPLEVAQEVELEILLEELAEIIESEDGILIP